MILLLSGRYQSQINNIPAAATPTPAPAATPASTAA